MKYRELWGILIPSAAIGIAVVMSWLIAGLSLWKFVLRYFSRAAARSGTQWDNVFIAAAKTPVNLFIFAFAGWIGERYMRLPGGWDQTLDQAIRVIVILGLLLFVDRFLREAVELYRHHLGAYNLTRGFVRVFVRLFALAIGGLIILDTLHISITPLIASLGVGGLAVGLALQGTLSNLFAGVQVIGTQPIRVGDFVKLESGEEGYVIEIGWRATRIRMLPNNTVIIPNARLADSVITNYYLPDRELAVLVQVGVSYNSDLAHVERVTIEVAKNIQETVSGAVPDFQPFIRYHTFDASSINFTVIMRAKEFTDNFPMKHEFIKQLHARYRQEGIVIPWPIRTLDVPREVLERLSPPSDPIRSREDEAEGKAGN
jgi:small-conductance mechanosensitive channel